VNANGGVNQQEYNYTDLTPNPTPKERGTLFYRLEIVDNNGSKTYSEIREVQIQNGGLSIYPNPAHEYIMIATDGVQQVNIINGMGQLVASQNVNSSNTKIALPILAKGIYYVKCMKSDGTVITNKLMIQ